MSKTKADRIVVLIDMDCFFCQVETKLQPEYAGKPLAVVQYNQWQLGGIIAVNYEARDHGVSRHMRGDEAKEKCPQLILVSVPCLRGKSDTSRYRAAGREVVDVIKKYCSVIERASVDEAYIDITDIVDKSMDMNPMTVKDVLSKLRNTFVVGYSEIGKNNEDERKKGTASWVSNVFHELEDQQAQRLAIAGVIVEELREAIFQETGYRCSAGIAQNKILAKLACGLHKPNRQTILPPAAVPSLYSSLPVKKVRNLGGKFGDVVVESLNCNVMGDLLQYSLQYLQKRFDEKTGLWLYNIARGIDTEPVTTRLITKSIGACKKFPGKQAIVSLDVLKHWAGELAADVCERLEQDMEENQRRATLLTISYSYYHNRNTISQSRSITLTSYKSEKMTDRCVEIITKATQCPIAFFGMSAGKFVPAKGSGTFMNFFKSNSCNTDQDNNDSQYHTSKPGTPLSENNAETTEQLNNSKPNVNIVNTVRPDNKLICTILPKVEQSDTIRRKHDVFASTMNNVSTTSFSETNNSPTSKKAMNSVSTVTETNDSPTSKKVNNLIKSLNERNKDTALYKSILSTCVANECLDQEKFRGSFFMSAFNEVDEKPKCKMRIITSETRKYNDKIESESVYDRKGSDESNIDQSISDQSNNSSKEFCESSEDHSKIDILAKPLIEDRFLDNNIHSIVGNQAIIPQPSTIKKKCVTVVENSNQETLQNHIYNGNESSSVRLQDIFPDLNSMDPNIVSLLPLDLQDEAQAYLKAKSTYPENRKANVKGAKTETASKTSKTRNPKVKASATKAKKSNLYSFLVKSTTKNANDTPQQRCSQCQQMILLSRYHEHIDFHVAENLQRELNSTGVSTTKRKIESEPVEPTIKRRPNTDLLKSDKNARSITAFF